MNESHVILYHGGGVEFTTEEKTDKITEALAHGLKGAKRDDGGWMAFSSIANIMSIEAYYTAHPDKRPETPRQFVLPPATSAYTENAKRLILSGLKKYIVENPPAERAQQEYDVLAKSYGLSETNIVAWSGKL